ncbi:MAG: isoprenylcysteine carboxylmethyltransferase family protein [Dehalococcoidia bacterium]
MAARAAADPTTRSHVSPSAFLQDAALVLVSTLFFWANAREALDGHLRNIPFAFEQGLLVFMFLSRRRAIATSTRPIDWVVAIGGWTALLLRPHDGHSTPELAGTAIQVAGLCLVFVGFSYLGRSFGVVAANRGLKVNGPYRLVRHPIYFAHFVTMSGYIVGNPTPWNIGVFALTAIFQVLRIRAEERILSDTANYAEYRARVRYRLLPGIW